ncbi:MAG: hypothetical protein JNM56_03815 [Planctomycetia bacterium]|nr:hypothetical protein [Planctomycetia bacterium]
MSMYYPQLAEIVKRDPRYSYEAYQFVQEALEFTQRRLGRQRRPDKTDEVHPENHVRGWELLDGIRELALREFGLMARTVFRMWGIQKTDDFGEIVFNLVESNLMSKTDDDDRKDFQNVYDLDEALVRNYRIRLDEAE